MQILQYFKKSITFTFNVEKTLKLLPCNHNTSIANILVMAGQQEEFQPGNSPQTVLKVYSGEFE